MTIQFAGVDLLLEDPEGAVRTWLDRHLNELHASIFCTENTAIREARFASVRNPGSPVTASSSSGWPAFDTPTVRRVGLPVGNYPKPPRPRINSLYWPTGATRWANALFLIRGDVLESLVETLQGEQSGLLTMADSNGSGFSTSMYMLAPRPVSANGVASGDRLWLLPLVDARYFWQYCHVELYAPSTWAEALRTIFGVSTNDAIQLGEAVPAVYGRPSAVEFVRDFENAAVLADAIALTLQRRIVGTFGDTVYKFSAYTVQTSDQATTQVAANFSQGFPEVAGGDFSSVAGVLGNVPSRIVVTYGNNTGDRVSGYGKQSITGTSVHSGSKVFHCSAVGSGNISDSGEYVRGFEAALPQQIASDYYYWLLFQYDVTFAGIVPWVPSGCDDYVRWEMTVKGKGRRRKLVCQTRAVSMPPNFGCESLPIDPLAESSSSSSRSSSSQSSSSQSSSSQSSQSSESSGSSGSTFSRTSSQSSGSSRSQSSASSASSESSSSESSSSDSSSSISSESSTSSGSSETSSGISSGESQPSSGSSGTSRTSSTASSRGSGSSGSSASLGSSDSSDSSQSSGSSGSSESQSSGSQSGSGTSNTSSGGSGGGGSGGSGSGGSDGSSGTSGTSSGSATSSGSQTSNGSGGSTGSSGSGGSGSSGTGGCCVTIVTSVSCAGGELSVSNGQLCIQNGCPVIQPLP